MSGERCKISRCRTLLVFATNGFGKLVASCPACDRRRAGVCADCPGQVEGTIGKAVRCHAHKVVTRKECQAKWQRDNRDVRNKAQRRRWRESEVRREKHVASSREWRHRNPERVKRQKRRYALKQTPGYIAGYKRWNKDPIRAAKKRAQSLAKYYELHPVRPDPHCSGCGVPIEWNGHARPRQTCDQCCSPAELRRRLSRPSRARAA